MKNEKKDVIKTKKQLIDELRELRQCIVDLQSSKAKESKVGGRSAKKEEIEGHIKYIGVNYKSLINNLNVGLFRTTLGSKGNFIEVNNALVKMFAYKSRQELLAMSVSELYENPENRKKYNEKMLKAGFVKSFENVFKKKDGSTFTGAVSAVAVKGRDGQFLYFDGIVEDITDRKKAEQTLAERLRFEKLILELSAKFINLPASKIDKQIKHGLKLIVEVLKIDRCSIGEFSEDKSEMQIKHTYSIPGIKPMPPIIFNKHLPLYVEKARKGEILLVSRVNDLPEKASIEKKFFIKEGIKSSIAIPLTVGGSFLGNIGFVFLRSEKVWHHELVQRLILISEIFANALMRKRTDQNLKNSFDQIKKLKEQLQAENVYLREEIKVQSYHGDIIGQSKALKKVLNQVEQVARTDSTVLILGETGTGKELLAKAIHKLSTRKDGTLVKVNCSALPPTLVESELFGREKGAYTGAHAKQAGRFEIAHGSTIFLDEIGELPIEVQTKLLRVLEEGKFERLGSSKTLKVDVRIIAATNRDLSKAVEQGSFREDLYYRLNVFPIFVPPLCERQEDIPLLVWTFVNEFEESMAKTIEKIPKENMDALQQYTWPGNVRELRNLVERAMILSNDSILYIDIPKIERSIKQQIISLEELDKKYILNILERTGWRIRGRNGAAEILGLKPTTLDSKIKKLGISRRPKSTEYHRLSEI